MSVTLEFETPTTERVVTGLFSLDRALGSRDTLGIPARTIYEIYGNEHVGKSTLAYHLAGKIAENSVYLCDLEGFDAEYMVAVFNHAKWDGTIKVTPVNEKKKVRSHEDILDETLENFFLEDTVTSAMIDSIGAIIPTAEADSELQDALIGNRARLVARLIRRATSHIRNRPNPGAIFVINHVHQVISGRGHTTPGGVTPKYLAGVRLYLYNAEAIRSSDDAKTDLCYVIGGNVEKLRYGGKGRKFKVANLPGLGIDKNMTALLDCVELGVATRGATVKIGDKSLGYLSKLIESAREGKDEVFQPFFELLDIERSKYGTGKLGVHETDLSPLGII